MTLTEVHAASDPADTVRQLDALRQLLESLASNKLLDNGVIPIGTFLKLEPDGLEELQEDINEDIFTRVNELLEDLFELEDDDQRLLAVRAHRSKW